ncbi:ninein-like protein [Cyrtonyx montezumae]|uniref:ninein-like protein n=1 Tax=Cyrtonyx montezumae TaxID=9017 RepID=UPI0032DA4438
MGLPKTGKHKDKLSKEKVEGLAEAAKLKELVHCIHLSSLGLALPSHQVLHHWFKPFLTLAQGPSGNPVSADIPSPNLGACFYLFIFNCLYLLLNVLQSRKGKVEVSHVNVKEGQLAHELLEHEDDHSTSTGSIQLQNQRLKEAEQLQGVEMATRLEHWQQHAACWSEMELLRQQLEASQEELLEAKVSLSVAQTQHALQLQQAKEQLNNVVPRNQFEQLQTSLREEQSRVQQLQANLQQQAEQACRQLAKTQEEHERLLQAAMEQAEGLQCDLRNAEAALADRAALLKDAQAQLSRNKLLIKDLHEENRGFAMALQAAEVKQKSIEKKNHVLEEQALALKKLIGKITPASLSA